MGKSPFPIYYSDFFWRFIKEIKIYVKPERKDNVINEPVQVIQYHNSVTARMREMKTHNRKSSKKHLKKNA